jgi:hypothetical protein
MSLEQSAAHRTPGGASSDHHSGASSDHHSHPPVVTAVLGHAAGTTTAAHYLRLDTEHLRRCALDVEDVLDAREGARP